MEITLFSGKKVNIESDPKENVHVLSPGYIITPEGACVEIEEGYDHTSKISDYLNFYLENKTPHYYELFEGIQMLTSFSHILFYGIRLGDIASQESSFNGINGCCYVFLPSDLSLVTSEAKEVLRILEASNHSIFRPNDVKVPLYYNAFGRDDPLTFEEVGHLLTENVKKKEING